MKVAQKLGDTDIEVRVSSKFVRKFGDLTDEKNERRMEAVLRAMLACVERDINPAENQSADEGNEV